MSFVASRMQREPNKTQMAVELAYDLTRNNITGGNIADARLARRWFPFLAGLFFFIWFSNMIGFLPLPINTEHKVDVFGLAIPSLALLRGDREPLDPARADARRLVLLPRRGHPGEGLLRLPGELAAPRARGHEHRSRKAFIFVIEAISHFARLISLSVRLFANILAGHLLLLFMGGGLAVLLGVAALGIADLPAGVRLLPASRWG